MNRTELTFSHFGSNHNKTATAMGSEPSRSNVTSPIRSWSVARSQQRNASQLHGDFHQHHGGGSLELLSELFFTPRDPVEGVKGWERLDT